MTTLTLLAAIVGASLAAYALGEYALATYRRYGLLETVFTIGAVLVITFVLIALLTWGTTLAADLAANAGGY